MRETRAAKKALFAAIQKSDLTIREKAFLRVAIAFNLEAVIEIVEGMAIDQGVANAQGQIDWEAIGDFIVKVLPLIIEAIIKLAPIFGGLV